MGFFKTCLALCRVSNLPTVWTNVLSAGLLASGQFHPDQFMLLALALSFFYSAGMALNDVCDAGHDKRHRPSRPIPSGRISPAGARRLTRILFLCGFAGLALAPYWSGLAAGLLLLGAIVVYDLNHKGNPLAVLWMAACRFLVFVVVSLAVSDRLPAPVLVAGVIQFCYVVAISLVARHEGHRSQPFRFPVVPALLAGISLLDGVILAILHAGPWLWAGVAGAAATWVGQRFIRGD